MLSLLFVFRRLLIGLRATWDEGAFRAALLMLIVLLVCGTVFYSTVEGWSAIDALYFSVVTLATVGYGDLAPHTTAGKLFTMGYIFVGIGLFVAVAGAISRGHTRPKSERRYRGKKKGTNEPLAHPEEDD